MKKLLLSLAAFLFVSGVAFAGLQINPATGKLDKVGAGSGGAASGWTTDSSTKTTTTYNVGIGSADPTQAVDVVGKVKASQGFVSGGISNPSIQFNANTSGDTSFWCGLVEDSDGVDNDLYQCGGNLSPGSNPIMTMLSSGNVGIGTTSPNALFNAMTFKPLSVSTTPGTPGKSYMIIGASQTIGEGGDTTIATTGVGGIGSGMTLFLGKGGNANSALVSATGGVGGAFSLTAGTGGPASADGTGDNQGGTGGAITLNGGAGGTGTGATSGTNRGGSGGAVTLKGGTGGIASSGSGTLDGGNGGSAILQGGTAGTGTTSNASNGGSAQVLGGSPAASAGSDGGVVVVTAANGSTTGSGGAGGAITLTAGDAKGDATSNRLGGDITLSSGDSIRSSTGGDIYFLGGTGGAGSSTTGFQGGNVTITPGPGGAGSGTGGVGGDTIINAGIGGDSTTDGVGGAIKFLTADTLTLTERARISPSGNVGINTTNPGAVLDIGSGRMRLVGIGTSTPGTATCFKADGTIGWASGTLTGNTWSTCN